MNKKMRNLAEMDYYANFNVVGEVLIKLKKENPNNESLKDAIEAMTQIGFYVNSIMREHELYEMSMQSYQSDKLRAVKRARRAEEELEQINKKNKI